MTVPQAPLRARRYFSEDDSVGVTPSRLRKMGKERQLEYMRFWFFTYFEDPVHETPFDSGEGGYLYIHGGPYDAGEQLYDEFSGIVDDDRIAAVVEDIESEGAEWAPTSMHPDRADEGAEYENEGAPNSDLLDTLIERLEEGVVPKFGDSGDQSKRSEVLSRIAALEQQVADLKPVHGGIGHNGPPPDEDNDEFTELKGKIEQLQTEVISIKNELAKAQPNALAIAQSAKALTVFSDWLFGKMNSFADSFVKTLGAATAGGTVIANWPALSNSVQSVSAATIDWLMNVTLPF